jgi:hypothetical protein
MNPPKITSRIDTSPLTPVDNKPDYLLERSTSPINHNYIPHDMPVNRTFSGRENISPRGNIGDASTLADFFTDPNQGYQGYRGNPWGGNPSGGHHNQDDPWGRRGSSSPRHGGNHFSSNPYGGWKPHEHPSPPFIPPHCDYPPYTPRLPIGFPPPYTGWGNIIDPPPIFPTPPFDPVPPAPPPAPPIEPAPPAPPVDPTPPPAPPPVEPDPPAPPVDPTPPPAPPPVEPDPPAPPPAPPASVPTSANILTQRIAGSTITVPEGQSPTAFVRNIPDAQLKDIPNRDLMELQRLVINEARAGNVPLDRSRTQIARLDAETELPPSFATQVDTEAQAAANAVKTATYQVSGQTKTYDQMLAEWPQYTTEQRREIFTQIHNTHVQNNLGGRLTTLAFETSDPNTIASYNPVTNQVMLNEGSIYFDPASPEGQDPRNAIAALLHEERHARNDQLQERQNDPATAITSDDPNYDAIASLLLNSKVYNPPVSDDPATSIDESRRYFANIEETLAFRAEQQIRVALGLASDISQGQLAFVNGTTQGVDFIPQGAVV